MQLRRFLKFAVIIICVGLMLCVWPLGFARQTVQYYPALGIAYEKTEQRIAHDAPLDQYFVAQSSRLDNLAFAVGFEGELPQTGALYVELSDADGHVLARNAIPFSELTDCYFMAADLSASLHKGKTYRIRFSTDSQHDGLFWAYYTRDPGQSAPGSLYFYMGDNPIEGASLLRYDYGEILGKKSILGIWAFLLTIGFTVLRLITEDEKTNA